MILSVCFNFEKATREVVKLNCDDIFVVLFLYYSFNLVNSCIMSSLNGKSKLFYNHYTLTNEALSIAE